MVSDLWGHSANAGGSRHLLADHLRGSATLAAGFAREFGAAGVAGYLALVHDVGKGSCEWQVKLRRVEREGGRVGIDHKHAGAWLAKRQGLDFLSAAVLGHHGGLPDAVTLKNALKDGRRERPGWEETVERVATVVPEIRPDSPPAWPGWVSSCDLYEAEMLVRMVFSAVVDADFLDTELHFSGGRASVSSLLGADGLCERFEEGRARLLAGREPSPVDAVRRAVYEESVKASAGPQGVYRMPAPTGSGKTLASAGFAFHHARVHGLRRVFIAVPFLSITDQNADVLRRVLEREGEPPVVLEHHSGVDLDEEDGDARRRTSKGATRWRRLAAENWDAPVVVTTTVRLFESLFDRRPAAMRRLHRLANSVIVLDEVQALPDRLLVPILSALRTLTRRFGVTVVLASATQPDFWRLSPFKDLLAHDVIGDPAGLYANLRRVEYQWRTGPSKPSTAEVAGEIAGCRQVLAIVNTTRNAQELHELVEEAREPELGPVMHLSTRMVAKHRRTVLARVRRLLDGGEPVAVVSTQLVEAGVDLDLPVVYRAKAPADSVQQAAGRCNRSGRLARGKVVIFETEGDRSAELIYRQAVSASDAFIGFGKAHPEDLEAIAGYYGERYVLKNVETGSREIQALREKRDFPAVARLFRMIDERTVSVVVPYGEQEEQERVRAAVAQIQAGVPYAGALLRTLRPYLATLPLFTARTALSEGLAEPVIGDLVHWLGDYHPQRGIELSDSRTYIF